MISDGIAGIFIVYQNGTDLRVRAIDSTGQIGNSVSIGTLSNAQNFYAAAPFPGIGWVVVHQSSATVLTIQKMVGTSATGSQTVTIASGNKAPVSIYADTTHVYVGWALRGGASFDAECKVFNTALALTSTHSLWALGSGNPYLGPPLFGSCVRSGRALALVSYAEEARPWVQSMKTRSFEIAATGGKVTGADNLSIIPLSAPFNNGMWWARHATEQPAGIQTERAVLLDFQENRVSTSDSSFQLQYPKVLLVCDAITLPDGMQIPANVYLQHQHTPARLSNGEWVMGVARLARAENLNSTSLNEGYLPLCEWLKFATECEQQVVTCGDDVIVAGSPTSCVYGLGSYQYSNSGTTKARPSQGLDLGFIAMPSIRQADSFHGSPGDLVAGATYRYRAVTEVIDSRGRRHRSAPSNVRRARSIPATRLRSSRSTSGSLYSGSSTKSPPTAAWSCTSIGAPMWGELRADHGRPGRSRTLYFGQHELDRSARRRPVGATRVSLHRWRCSGERPPAQLPLHRCH